MFTQNDLQELEFNEINNPPAVGCNMCGKPLKSSARVASIEPDIVVLVCNSTCEQGFKCHPVTVAYVNDMVEKVNQIR